MEMISREELIARVEKKKLILAEAAISLKSYFVGIDEIIDQIIKDIETWYVFPELLTRPVIVCLWGPTGVGKTDLVRRLIKLLQFSDRYVEVELSNKGCSAYPWDKNIASILSRYPNVTSGGSSIILLDEIQGFRTIDEAGHEILDYNLRDIWTLLSDGKLPYRPDVDALLGMLWEINKKTILPETDNKKAIKTKKISEKKCPEIATTAPALSPDTQTSYYYLSYFKSLLRLKEPIEEIALWDEKKKKDMIIQKLSDKSVYEEEDYTKSLIFVSGNLDEAYGFTKETSEADVDADILHDMSLRINILDIKDALAKRFRPEQVSRFGNTHIIYPTLDRNSFQEIINRRVETIRHNIVNKVGVDIEVDNSIKTLIYDNGVFPTQGTRPILSTISEVLEASLPPFLLQAKILQQEKITVYYDFATNNICARVNGCIKSVPYFGTLDIIKAKRNKNEDGKVLSCVHEAGHALVFAKLFGYSPSQIIATPVSNDAGGFIFTQPICDSLQMSTDRICVMLAGKEAEKIVFGDSYQSAGCASDLNKATLKASSIVREWGMGRFNSVVASESRHDGFNSDVISTNKDVENILCEASLRTAGIIAGSLPLLMQMVDKLVADDKILPQDFKKMCDKYGIAISLPKSSGEEIFLNYNCKYNEFKNAIMND